MLAYQFETPMQDKEFLAGNEVTCRAILKDQNSLAQGEFVLVLLTTGKKYKARVIEFRSFPVQDYLAGDLVLVKT
jgi:hypothetical protein